jgi:hypothetical protein
MANFYLSAAKRQPHTRHSQHSAELGSNPVGMYIAFSKLGWNWWS